MNTLGFTDKYIYLNGKIIESEGYHPEPAGSTINYEVIRIIGGKPLFIEDHLTRLKHSIWLTNGTVVDLNSFGYQTQIKELCKANQKYFGNIELRFYVDEVLGNQSLLGFIPHTYPSTMDYFKGVNTGKLFLERENPNAKVKNTQTRIAANNFLQQKKLYEAILINHDGMVTEGSRSNLFFINQQGIYTAHSQLILLGITRKYAIQAINNVNLNFSEKLIHVSELETFQAAFLCGTSPGILPISQIDTLTFNTNHPDLRMIMQSFNDLVTNYLSLY